MTKFFFILLSLLILSGCATDLPVYKPIEEYAVTCSQTDEQVANNEQTCARIRSFPDTLKWHRVPAWETMGEIPELP